MMSRNLFFCTFLVRPDVRSGSWLSHIICLPTFAKERATYSGEGVEGTHGKVNNPTGKSGDEVRTNE